MKKVLIGVTVKNMLMLSCSLKQLKCNHDLTPDNYQITQDVRLLVGFYDVRLSFKERLTLAWSVIFNKKSPEIFF